MPATRDVVTVQKAALAGAAGVVGGGQLMTVRAVLVGIEG